MATGTWQTAAAVLAVLTPLIGVPLTVITFYLKSLREHQVGRFADLSRRVDVIESSLHRIEGDCASMRRDTATKEEWLRESMWARGQIETLAASMARAETELDGMATLLTTVERTGRLVASIGRRLGEPGDTASAPDKEPL